MDTDSTISFELAELHELRGILLDAVMAHQALGAVDTMSTTMAAELGIVAQDDLDLINGFLNSRLREFLNRAEQIVVSKLPVHDVPF